MYRSTFSWPGHQLKVSGQLRCLYRLDRRLGGPHSRSGRYGEVTILYPTGTRSPTPRSSMPLPVAIPTELPRLLFLGSNPMQQIPSWEEVNRVLSVNTYTSHLNTLHILKHSKHICYTYWRSDSMFNFNAYNSTTTKLPISHISAVS
jgi:hypothetical protein